MKDITKELQNFTKEKEFIEKRRTKALEKHTELELDVKDLQEKMSGNIRAKVFFYYHLTRSFDWMDLYMVHLLPTFFQKDAARQLNLLEKEIQDSMDEPDKISPGLT